MKFKNCQRHWSFRYLFVSAALIFGSVSSFAQHIIAVAPNKMNVLYIGVDNPVTVAASNSNDDRVTVSISGCEGSASKVSTGIYNVRVAAVTDECSMNVYVDGKLVGTSNFRVRNLPAPYGTIGGFISGSNVAADKIKSQAGLGVYVRDFPFEVKYEVLGFTFSVEDDKRSIATANNEGALFSSQARQYIDEYVKAGKMVTIESIRVKDPAGRVIKLPSLVYYVK
ncbi:MAG TPA: GldM family protein [Flavisolibacter sp.]|nr:GldM family protein [Flavisolibacter sp.]